MPSVPVNWGRATIGTALPVMLGDHLVRMFEQKGKSPRDTLDCLGFGTGPDFDKDLKAADHCGRLTLLWAALGITHVGFKTHLFAKAETVDDRLRHALKGGEMPLRVVDSALPFITEPHRMVKRGKEARSRAQTQSVLSVMLGDHLVRVFETTGESPRDTLACLGFKTDPDFDETLSTEDRVGRLKVVWAALGRNASCFPTEQFAQAATVDERIEIAQSGMMCVSIGRD